MSKCFYTHSIFTFLLFFLANLLKLLYLWNQEFNFYFILCVFQACWKPAETFSWEDPIQIKTPASTPSCQASPPPALKTFPIRSFHLRPVSIRLLLPAFPASSTLLSAVSQFLRVSPPVQLTDFSGISRKTPPPSTWHPPRPQLKDGAAPPASGERREPTVCRHGFRLQLPVQWSALLCSHFFLSFYTHH